VVAVGSGERIIAGWILERRLGAGGYGEVWQARRRHVDLVRALKLIPMVSEAAFESWRHEIGRLEALNHPNVVRFYDADIVSDGVYRDHAWIATELCERSLADGLRRRERHVLPYAEGESLLDAMLAALSAAHAAGMVHRDIKPANIVRHRDGTWKLCDFGTARLVPTDATHPVTQVVGTSPYMSPGAHRGQQNQAADLYALGVTMHEALRGERLHPRPEDMTDGEYVKTVLDTPPTISPDLPRRWRTVIAALIGDHGPLTAVQLAEWFTATRGDQPPPAPPPPPSLLPAPAGAAIPKTGATVVARPPSGPATGATVAAHGAARVNGSRAGSEVRRVHVPAPKPEALPPPPPPPSPPVAQRSPTPSPSPAPRPVAPPPAPAPRPFTPQPAAVAPPPIWTGAAVDPTAPMGRRVFAVLLDALVLAVMANALLVAAVVSTYKQVPAVQGSESVASTCDDFGDVRGCREFGNTIYVSEGLSLDVAPFALVAGVMMLIVLQGVTGATVGKFLVGLRVVDRDGRPPGLARATVRTVMLVIDAAPWAVPLLGWAVAVTHPRHRRLGDLAAGTMVVRRRTLAYIRR
jgi:serine/threonine-protein kinase